MHRLELGAIFARPVVDGDRVVVSTLSGSVVALDGAEPAFTVAAPAAVDGAVGVGHDGTYVVPCHDGTLLGLGSDGAERWRFDARTDSPVVSPSSSRGWRSDVLVTPDGLVVAGSEDFHVYGLSLGGELRWTAPTGLAVRGSPALGPDGSVLVTSLDLSLVALDPESGALRWRRPLHNLPGGLTVAPDGTAAVSTLGGAVLAFDAATGEERWRRELSSPLATAPAPCGDGWVVGTVDGRLVHLGPTGQVRHQTFLGGPVRAGVAVAADGVTWAGAGSDLVSVAPDGSVLRRADPGIGELAARVVLRGDGCLVVGRRGLARVPFDAVVEAGDQGPEGGRLHAVLADGRLDPEPAGPVRTRPGDVVSLRVLHRDVEVEPAWVGPPLRSTSELAHAARWTAEATHLHLVPEGLVDGAFSVAIETAYRAGGERRALQAAVQLTSDAVEGTVPERLRIGDLHLHDPGVVQAFDPAALAATTFDIVRIEPGVAWGFERRGARVFAFATREVPGSILLEAAGCRVDLAGIGVTLSRLRLAAHADGAGTLLAEAGPSGRSWPSLQQALDHPRAALERSGKPFLAARDLFRRAAGVFEGRPSLDQLADLGRLAPRTLALGPRLLDPAAWGPWGLLDADRAFLGVGRFSVVAVPELVPAIRVEEVRADAARRLVTARLVPDGGVSADVVVGVLLIDTDAGAPVVLDYTGRTRVHRDSDGRPVEVRFEIPLSTNLSRPIDALVMVDLHTAWRGALTG